MTTALRRLYETNSGGQEQSFDFSATLVRESVVDGRGVYAAHDIEAGAFVAPLTGILRHSSIVESPAYDKMALQIDDKWWLEEAGYPDDFINHSCSPNLKFSPDGTFFSALRDIKQGEELFFDYATSLYDGGWSMPCHCASPHCRKTITGFEDLNPALKESLLELTLPYIRKRYE